MPESAQIPVRNHLVNAFYGIRDRQAFASAVQAAVNQVTQGGVFIGDNLIAFGRNLSFLHDESFMEIFKRHADEGQEQSIIWRVYVLAWAARRSLKVAGDFVECACYKGTSARILADYLELKSTGRQYYLYDLFEHDDAHAHLRLNAHGAGLYEQVCGRFADLDNVHVTRGRVPDVLTEIAPERIAFMHIDINDAAAELGTLELLFDRVSPGGTVVLDDYGWLVYGHQKLAEDPFFEARGYQVLELPTGQGLVIK